MSQKITTPYGYPMPPAPRHSVTTHMPTWKTLMDFVENPPAVVGKLKNAYPRLVPHADVRSVSVRCPILSRTQPSLIVD